MRPASDYKLSIKLSIIVPVYRSATILPHLVKLIDAAMLKEDLTGNFELLLVNDASPDNSWEIILALAKEHPFIYGINLRRNVGQHNAIMAGLNHVKGQFVALIDDDLQHSPDVLGDMLRALGDKYDVCYANYINRKHARWKRLGSHFNNYVAKILLDKPKHLYLSSLKVMRREIAEEIIKYDGPYTYIDGLILDITQAITSIDISHQERYSGKSNYDISRLISLSLKMTTGFSILPLRLATSIGFLLFITSIFMTGVIVVMKIQHPEYPSGWASLITTVLFLGGIQILCVGILGEYLGRIYLKLNRKRQFVIGNTTRTMLDQHK